MTQKNLTDILDGLAKKRPVFHSEADFQFELAWAIKQQFTSIDIRLERPYQLPASGKVESDLIVINGSNVYGIELKYVTKKANLTVNGENFDLKEHAATNLRRYDFYKDISRLENMKKEKLIITGFVIFLTNVNSYLNRSVGVASNFNFSDRHTIIKGQYNWNDNWANDDVLKIKSIGKTRVNPISITSLYNCIWKQYPTISSTNNPEEFKYLLLEI